ncbi:helix-turn-helix domain-containing protein [Persephonella sp.]
MENIGQRIKELRKMLGLSQREFAERIGKSLNAIQKWESGDRIPSEPALKLIAKEFGVSEEWLKTGEGEVFVKKLPEFAEGLDDFLKDFLTSYLELSEEEKQYYYHEIKAKALKKKIEGKDGKS